MRFEPMIALAGEQTQNCMCQFCATSLTQFLLRSANRCTNLQRKDMNRLRISGVFGSARGGPPLPNEGLLSGRVDQ